MKFTIIYTPYLTQSVWYVYIDGVDIEPLVMDSLDDLRTTLENAGFIIPGDPRPAAAATLGHSKSESKAAAARQNGRKGGRPALRTRAANRIDKMGFTEQQSDFIWADWPNIDEHYRWLLTASKDEIVDWIDAGQ